MTSTACAPVARETVERIANRLVALCRQQQYQQAIQELYSPDIVSVEMNGQPHRVQGFEALRQKEEQWEADFEVHSITVSEPLISDNEFAVVMQLDATHRPSGQRMPMSEICVYEVANGQIVREYFIYPPMPSEGCSG